MLKAIHKKSGKLVTAFKLESDASYIRKEKDKWISPYVEIDNWKFLKEKGVKEVEVSFVRSHVRKINNKNTSVISHFRINNKYAKPNPLNESEEHKLAKEGIYEDVINNEIKINGKRIRDLFEIDDVYIEHRLSKSKNSKIADVIINFDKKDIEYWKGIIFEIQLSPQNFEQTEDRTYDRILEGYSVVWLWEGMFNKDNKLKNKEVTVIPYLKASEEYKKKKKIEFCEEINQYGILIDKKVEEAKRLIDKKIEVELENKLQKKINRKVILYMENRFRNLYSGMKIGVTGECFKCKKNVSMKGIEYENGNPYCDKCFNELPSNWRKDYLEMTKNNSFYKKKHMDHDLRIFL